MDLTQDIIYRGFTLNDASIAADVVAGNGIGGGISGCVLDSFDPWDVDVVQFMEKKSLEDGMDVGQVFRGARRVRLSGTLYGTSRADLYDRFSNLRAALDPVLAAADEPADLGYQPLYFSRPTLNLTAGTGFPSGYIDHRILCMPRAFAAPIQRDLMGGDDEDALAVQWQATLIARDPRIYGEEAQEYSLGTATGTVTGDLINRGNHYGVLNMLITVGTVAGTIAVTAGTSVFTITVPVSTNNQIIRVKGDQKIITFEDAVTAVEVTDMAKIAFTGDNTWAQVAPGTTAYSVTFNTVTPQTGSMMWFWESYA